MKRRTVVGLFRFRFNGAEDYCLAVEGVGADGEALRVEADTAKSLQELLARGWRFSSLPGPTHTFTDTAFILLERDEDIR